MTAFLLKSIKHITKDTFILIKKDYIMSPHVKLEYEMLNNEVECLEILSAVSDFR